MSAPFTSWLVAGLAAAGTPAYYSQLWSLAEWRSSRAPVARFLERRIIQDAGGDGSGAGGDGSAASPYKTATLAHLSTLLSAIYSVPNIAARLRYGDEWIGVVGPAAITQSSVTLGAFSDGTPGHEATWENLPTLTFFAAAYGAGGWTLVAGTTYKRTETAAVYQVTDGAQTHEAQKENAWARRNSSADVQAQSRSFWKDGANNLLYVNFGAGGVLAGLRANKGAGRGIDIRGDFVRVDSIRMWCAGMQASASQDYGIGVYGEGVEAVASNDDVHFTSHHGIAAYTANGCILTAIGCDSGGCVPDALRNATVYNNYATHGGQESLFVNCTTTRSVLFTQEAPDKAGNGVIGFYGHTTDGTQVLYATLNCTVGAHARGCNLPSDIADLPAPADYEDLTLYRGHIVGEVFGGGDDTKGYKPCSNFLRVGCTTGVMHCTNQGAFSNSITAVNKGKCLDCVLRWKFDNIWNGALGQNGTAEVLEFVQCFVEVDSPAGATSRLYGWDRNDAGYKGAGIKARNTVFSNPGPGTFYVGIPNEAITGGANAGGMDGCAFYGTTAANSAAQFGYDGSLSPITLAARPMPDDVPAPGSALFRSGLVLPAALPVTVDRLRRERPRPPFTPSRGTLEGRIAAAGRNSERVGGWRLAGRTGVGVGL